MKRDVTLIAALIVLLCFSASAFAQVDTGRDTSLPAASSLQTQTMTGRIVALDVRSGAFSVREGDNGRVVSLMGRKNVNVARLRRGERVTVTYSGNVATDIKATRSKE